LWCAYAVAASFRPRWRRSLALDRGAVKAVRWLAIVALLANWGYVLAVR
jgi:hypothetical protein